jgi:hypothetical protein
MHVCTSTHGLFLTSGREKMHTVLYTYITYTNKSKADSTNKISLPWGGGPLFPPHRSHAGYQLPNVLPGHQPPSLCPDFSLAPLTCLLDIPFITTKRRHHHYGIAFQSGTAPSPLCKLKHNNAGPADGSFFPFCKSNHSVLSRPC